MINTNIATVTAIAIVLSGCSTTGSFNPDAQLSALSKTVKNTFDSDDPCANSMRNVGIVGGAVAGLIISNQIDHSGGSHVVGAATGAMLGAMIGDSVDKRKCAIWKIAQANHVPVTVATIKDSKGETVGADVTLGNPAQNGQFEPGSSTLTPEARAYYGEIAHQYSYTEQLAEHPAGQPESGGGESLKNAHIALIGHTDDTGDSQSNAKLSEQRAKAVAQVFESHGIPKGRVFYQGAGDAHPLADNKTPEGRAKNRRVEIVDAPDRNQLARFVQSQKTIPTYFEPPKTETAATSPVNYGGNPVTASTAASIDIGTISRGGFSLIGEANAEPSGIPSCVNSTFHDATPVRSLDGNSLAAADYLPNFVGDAWVAMSNGNLIAINGARVLRDGAEPDGHPELMVFKNYTPTKKSEKPTVNSGLNVNTYQGSKAMIYRVYPKKNIGLVCMDIVVPTATADRAANSSLFYHKSGQVYVTQIDAHLTNKYKRGD